MNYQILSGPFGKLNILSSANLKVGNIKFPYFTRNSYSELNGNKLNFTVRGFSGNKVIIKDGYDNSVKGEIKFQVWGPGAFITDSSGEHYTWHQSFFKSGSWYITHSQETVVSAKGLLKREINYRETNELLVLAGLFIWRRILQDYSLLAIILFLTIYLTV